MSDRTIFSTAPTDVDVSAQDALGSLRWYNGKLLKYVKFLNVTTTVAGVAGDIAAYKAETGVATHTVVLDLTDADVPPIPAGVLMGTVAGVHSPATPLYGWIQLRGPFTANQALGGSAADGHPLALGTTDKTLDKAIEVDAAGVYKTICAVANDASAKTCLATFPG